MGIDRVMQFIIGWSAAILSITGLYLMAKKKWQCYIPWLIAAPLWIILGFITKSYETIVTFICYQVMNIYGIYEWKLKKVKK